MRKALSSFAALLLVALALIATAPPAGATSTLWHLGDTTGSWAYIWSPPGTTVTAGCGSGSAALMGGYSVSANNGSSDVRRLNEYVNSYAGGGYSVYLDDETGANSRPAVTPWVRCVQASALVNSFQAAGTLTTGSNHIASGSVSCGTGAIAVSGSVSPWGTGGTVLTSTPSGGSTWSARTWSSDVGSTATLSVWCVPVGNFNGALRTVTSSAPVGWGTTASATCPSGFFPISAGTEQVGGDSGAITVAPKLTYGGWSSTTLSLSTGSMTTTLLCMPGWDPDVSISSHATPNPNSSTVEWDFTVTDRAAASGFTTSVTCEVVRGSNEGVVIVQGSQPCSSPKQVPNLLQGWNQLNLKAVTSDGRETLRSDSILVDYTAPVVTFDDAAGTVYPTGSPHVPVHVTDNFYLQKVQCAVDAGAFTDCGNSTQGAKTLALSGLTDGTHTLHVKAIDINTNQKTYDRAFKVDTTAPTVTLTGPASPVTVATSALATWTGTDAVAGVGGYDTQWQSAAYNADFGAWSAPVASAATATSRAFGSLTRGSTYCFQQRATDKVGHTSGWTASRCTAIPLDDRDLAASSGWRGLSSSGWFLGTSRLSTTKGARLAITGVTLQRISVVAKKCATCGVLGVYVGSTLLARIDLHSSTSARKVIALPLFTLRTGTVTLKVLSSGKPVQVDALAVSRR